MEADATGHDLDIGGLTVVEGQRLTVVQKLSHVQDARRRDTQARGEVPSWG
jgi:hypothetical protein